MGTPHRPDLVMNRLVYRLIFGAETHLKAAYRYPGAERPMKSSSAPNAFNVYKEPLWVTYIQLTLVPFS